MKILMVCLGNICRSPMADGLLRKKVAAHELNVVVDSAGTGDWHVGEAPDIRMQETAKKNGVHIANLQARQFTVNDFVDFDKIYVMDQSNYSNIIALANNNVKAIRKVELILNLIAPGKNQNVPDPYYGGDKGFQSVYDLLDAATDVIISNLNHEQ